MSQQDIKAQCEEEVEAEESSESEEAGLTQRKKVCKGKKEAFKRKYDCGCGKSYMSYAALYTHTKTKHNGAMVEGTTAKIKKRQGRPKKDDLCLSVSRVSCQRVLDFSKDFQHFLEMIPGAREESIDGGRGLIEAFPVEIFVRQDAYDRLLKGLESARNDFYECHGQGFMDQIEDILLETCSERRLSCNDAFSLFLIFSYRSVSREFFRDLVFFVAGFRFTANKIGWDRCKELRESLEVDNSMEFCETQSPELLPDIANVFLLDFFPDLISSTIFLRQPEAVKFLGLDSIKLLRVILLIKHFCNWLFCHRLSNAVLEILKTE